ncbi:aspartate-semialdehyde dehydrogenase [Clostridium acetobutylicum]|uniref:Aspartate semialdehyde dehydrogenase (Gene asd) n=1 Tax=Clostridium acetobutylicum (strain ATCC 824 / DSM 792 / JCM 1419 / IAM 19013 / LMG 5710 / NBRC 13948 / NRRL B-527 / VKM B-1787 / 2291 / W) TaxID=272562 RepID=Q97LJ2_CLOAB|nr:MULTISPECIES: aspartate-semialdehyde dehydrogenase [Clostridium]AAK78547.1 Aspartate semialdehyde dehydrogenase (gene asd) [Clostridium acetobutylicum ATCC 824]ADZ19621.1 aspartate-semialdehyde dehydrogenase [Clostridium acetobutylicum EA 2018]AEI34530.1 aspartate-semialdehyde dehydrogenase [Clostridium acetobutylicum DSM 1731]AWV80270.1 aspartate-semialdehyde dehydrogenase [Clostridium acetobutylicum]MBC2392455.1 aspartate-semialdehyde dehydrogenase [Clostridium acetobutylicum]
MNKKLRVGLLGGTGLVGQRFATLLDNHPYFEVTCIAASPRSAGQKYSDAVKGRWKLDIPMPEYIKDFIVKDIYDIDEISKEVDFVFCAVNMDKSEIKKIEENYAKHEIPVVSNNSAHRFTEDVPVIIPEINPEHLDIIPKQKERLGTKKGFIVAKPNCSIQSYVPAISALLEFKPTKILVCTYQAISGSGKTFEQFPEIVDNTIPYIPGEEQKSEDEPLKVWGHIEGNKIVSKKDPLITSQCIRVAVSDGHLAATFVSFENKPTKEQIVEKLKNYKGKPQLLNLPTAPEQFITYFEDEFRPQPKLDRNIEKGMGISIGRLREDTLFDYKFVGLSHNALRGAAGGAVLTAELLYKEGYLY